MADHKANLAHEFQECYFGDPNENDDYAYAHEEGKAIYWHPLEQYPGTENV